MLKAMADNNINITTREDACLYNALAEQNYFIFKNVDDELAVVSRPDSLVVTLKKGGGVIRGRHFYEYGESTTLTLEPNSSGSLVIRYDLTQSVGNEVSFQGVPLVLNQDINNGGVACDLVLYTYVTSENGVTSLTDKRTYYSNKQPKNYYLGWITVNALQWKNGATEVGAGYTWYYDIPWNGIRPDMRVEVTFDQWAVESGILAACCGAYTNAVRIYANKQPTGAVGIHGVKAEETV
ncbi:MAG: hypothetical protein RR945_02175 [Erysipelotrichaceae bacterium]